MVLASWRAPRVARGRGCVRALRVESLESRQLLAAVVVSPTAGLQTSEDSGRAVVSVYLTEPPTAKVVIDLKSSNPLLGTPSTNSLTFTSANYKKPQTFSITGHEDDLVHGTAYYHIGLSIKTTAAAYASLTLPTLTIKSLHPRGLSPGISVSPASGLHTTKSGGTASFIIELTEKPRYPVTISVHTSNDKEGIPNVSSVTFSPANWHTAQRVTVTGQDDGLFGNTNYTIRLGPASSTDGEYKGIGASVALVNEAATDVGRFDGSYTGSYSGTATYQGIVQPVSGSVAFSVKDGKITVTTPASGSGTLAANGNGSFASGGLLDGAVFSGVFKGVAGTKDVGASGGWSFSVNGAVGNGAWTASRVG